MTLGMGLGALFVGSFLVIIGMYARASTPGTLAFFVGFALAMAGAGVAFAKAGRRSRY